MDLCGFYLFYHKVCMSMSLCSNYFVPLHAESVKH